jgi:ACS family hexuronate transporter-like MFS transporter
LFGIRQTWAYAIPKFLTDPIWWFYLYWLPGYFSDKFHLSLGRSGIAHPDRLQRLSHRQHLRRLPARILHPHGLSAERARLAAMLLCACLVVPVFLINYLHADNFGKWAAIGLLSLAAAAHQGWSATSSPRRRICSRAAPWARLPASAPWPERSAASSLPN